MQESAQDIAGIVSIENLTRAGVGDRRRVRAGSTHDVDNDSRMRAGHGGRLSSARAERIRKTRRAGQLELALDHHYNLHAMTRLPISFSNLIIQHVFVD